MKDNSRELGYSPNIRDRWKPSSAAQTVWEFDLVTLAMFQTFALVTLEDSLGRICPALMVALSIEHNCLSVLHHILIS